MLRSKFAAILFMKGLSGIKHLKLLLRVIASSLTTLLMVMILELSGGTDACSDCLQTAIRFYSVMVPVSPSSNGGYYCFCLSNSFIWFHGNGGCLSPSLQDNPHHLILSYLRVTIHLGDSWIFLLLSVPGTVRWCWDEVVHVTTNIYDSWVLGKGGSHVAGS